MIDLLPSEVEQQIIDGVAGFLAEELPLARLRPGPDGERSADIGISAEQWHEIAGLGWFGLGIPEERGGAGFTVVAEMLVVREVGRYAVSPSISATIAAACLAARADSRDGTRDLAHRLRCAGVARGVGLLGGSRHFRPAHAGGALRC